MSAQPPPIINVPIFNEINFTYVSEDLTLAEADLRFLKLSGGVITGLTTFSSGLNSTGIVNVNNTTQSTNRTSGALVVAGGLGVNLDTHMNNLHLNNSSSELKISGVNGYLTINNNTNPSTSSTTGAIRCAGGAYFGANSIMNGNLTINGSGSTTISNSPLYVSPLSTGLSGALNYYFTYLGQPSTTGSTTGIAPTLYIQGQPSSLSSLTGHALYINSGLFFTNGNIQSNSTTSSTSPTTGSLIINGGAGINQDLNVGRYIRHNSSGLQTTLSSTFDGFIYNMGSGQLTADSLTPATITNLVFHSIRQQTLGSVQVGGNTTTNAISNYIGGAPIKGTNQTITNTYGLYIDSANSTNATVSQAASLYIANAPTVSSGNTMALLVNAGRAEFRGTTRFSSNGSDITRVERGRTANSGSTTYTINFSNSFSSTPTVVASIELSSTAYNWGYVITSVSTSSFSYRFYAHTIANPSQCFNATDAHTLNWIAMN